MKNDNFSLNEGFENESMMDRLERLKPHIEVIEEALEYAQGRGLYMAEWYQHGEWGSGEPNMEMRRTMQDNVDIAMEAVGIDLKQLESERREFLNKIQKEARGG